MPQAAVIKAHVPTPEPIQTSSMRRFALPDLDTHGAWIMKRITSAYPNQTERSVAGWLRNLLYDNASLFLYQNSAVALFQVTSVYSLAHKPIVIERFVFVKEGPPSNLQEAAEFYSEAAKWSKNQQIEQMRVEEMSDVPHDLIKDKLGRLFTQQSVIARL